MGQRLPARNARAKHAGPETQLWLYSSLEHEHEHEHERDGDDDDDDDDDDGVPDACADQAVAAVRAVRRIRDGAEGPMTATRERTPAALVLAGGLGERLRRVLAGRGVVFPSVSLWDKWLFRVDALPRARVRGGADAGADADAGDADGALPGGMRWDVVAPADFPLVLSRTSIQRTE